MREILFRGKRIDNGEWIEGHLLWYEDGRARITPRHTEICYLEKDFNTIVHIAYEVIPESIGQYTGLTDKNGTKIFEGDIVKREYTLRHSETKRTRETQIGVVSYSNKECGFCLDKVCNLRKPWDGDTIEVIGNIHDNPELLKGGAGE